MRDGVLFNIILGASSKCVVRRGGGGSGHVVQNGFGAFVQPGRMRFGIGCDLKVIAPASAPPPQV